MIKLFSARESLVSDIPAEDGKNDNFSLRKLFRDTVPLMRRTYVGVDGEGVEEAGWWNIPWHLAQVLLPQPEPEFLNFYANQESIPRNQFRQPM